MRLHPPHPAPLRADPTTERALIDEPPVWRSLGLDARSIDLAGAAMLNDRQVIVLVTGDPELVTRWHTCTRAGLLVAAPSGHDAAAPALFLDAGADRCIITPTASELAAHARSLHRRLQPDHNPADSDRHKTPVHFALPALPPTPTEDNP